MAETLLRKCLSYCKRAPRFLFSLSLLPCDRVKKKMTYYAKFSGGKCGKMCRLCGKLTTLCGNFNKIDGKVRTTVKPKAVLTHNLKQGFTQKLAPSY